jgi:hypothetical protein
MTYHNIVVHYSAWILHYNVHTNETTIVNFWCRSYFHTTTGEVYLLTTLQGIPRLPADTESVLLAAAKRKKSGARTEIKPVMLLSQKRLNPFKKSVTKGESGRGLANLDASFAQQKSIKNRQDSTPEQRPPQQTKVSSNLTPLIHTETHYIVCDIKCSAGVQMPEVFYVACMIIGYFPQILVITTL